ncbi:MAG: hypothetical protein RJA70_2495 [Pseudomonadota bacterium]
MSLEAKLVAEIGDCLAGDVHAHSQRGALFVVDSALSLLEVGVAVAEDDVDRVSTWIANKQLQRPSQRQLARWLVCPDAPLRSLIVQPYVLVHELEPSPTSDSKGSN